MQRFNLGMTLRAYAALIRYIRSTLRAYAALTRYIRSTLRAYDIRVKNIAPNAVTLQTLKCCGDHGFGIGKPSFFCHNIDNSEKACEASNDFL